MYTVACPAQTEVQVINITSSDNLYNAALYCEETVEADLVSPIFPEIETLSVLQHRDSRLVAGGGGQNVQIMLRVLQPVIIIPSQSLPSLQITLLPFSRSMTSFLHGGPLTDKCNYYFH